jgi:DNA-binding transcriptional ArsR family regulator
MSQKNNVPEIQWDFGTAYELFVSLHVLHEPDYYGVRPSYAAGVRSRIPAAERKLLEDALPLMAMPLKWIHNLPAPKDAISALWALKQIPAAERILTLQRVHDVHDKYKNAEEIEKYTKFNAILLRVATEGKWKPEDSEFFIKVFNKKHENIKKEAIERALDWWSRPAEFGEGLLSALQAYYQSFFEEEEKRVEPILKAGMRRAQELAATKKFEELFSEISQGVQWGGEFLSKKIIIAPAFWTTPLIFFDKIDKDTLILLFGARPADMSVIPGETLPDGLVRSLKALADPTRLKILFYLSHESLSPSELARRLHLRAPTVTHHLSELRLASLVNVTIEGQEKKYRARSETLQSTFTSLQDFLKITEEADRFPVATP